jgi:DNA-binding transcriptional LysR family regulator
MHRFLLVDDWVGDRMDTLLSMKVFRLVAELKSFAAAAQRLGISPAMASKHVMHLEQRLSTRLLNRTSRCVNLSETGALYFEQSSQMLDALEEVEGVVSNAAAIPHGTLKLSAPNWMANAAFVSLLADYQRRYPEVQLDIDLGGRMVNLVDEGFDLALRLTHTQPQPGLIVRPLVKMPFQLVAAPAYLDRYGRPANTSELNGHHLLYDALTMNSTHTTKGPTGPLTIKFKPALQSDNQSLLHLAALEGMGVTLLPTFLIAEDLAAKRLEPLFPEQPKHETPLCGVYASRKYLSAKVRTFIDFIVDDLRFAM